MAGSAPSTALAVLAVLLVCLLLPHVHSQTMKLKQRLGVLIGNQASLQVNTGPSMLCATDNLCLITWLDQNSNLLSLVWDPTGGGPDRDITIAYSGVNSGAALVLNPALNGITAFFADTASTPLLNYGTFSLDSLTWGAKVPQTNVQVCNKNPSAVPIVKGTDTLYTIYYEGYGSECTGDLYAVNFTGTSVGPVVHVTTSDGPYIGTNGAPGGYLSSTNVQSLWYAGHGDGNVYLTSFDGSTGLWSPVSNQGLNGGATINGQPGVVGVSVGTSRALLSYVGQSNGDNLLNYVFFNGVSYTGATTTTYKAGAQYSNPYLTTFADKKTIAIVYVGYNVEVSVLSGEISE